MRRVVDGRATEHTAASTSQMGRFETEVLAYNLGNFLRQAVLPRSVRHWALTTLREKLIRHRHVDF
jgi:hypothetical protein